MAKVSVYTRVKVTVNTIFNRHDPRVVSVTAAK